MTEILEVKRGRGRPRIERPPKVLKGRGRKVGDKVTKETWHVLIKRLNADDIDLGNFATKEKIAEKLTELFKKDFKRSNVDSIIRGMANTKRGDIIITKI